MNFLQERQNVCYIGESRDVNYVDINDDSNTGFHLFRIDSVYEKENKVKINEVRILYKPLTGEELDVKLINTRDLTWTRVHFNDEIIKESLILMDFVRAESAGLVAITQHCIGRMVSRAYNSETWRRIFPKTLFNERRDVRQTINIFRKLFKRKIHRNHSFIKQFSSLKDYKFETYGQLFLVMFLVRYERYGNVSRSLRLMLFFLSVLVRERDNNEVLSNMYSWIVDDLCQSCSEKMLIKHHDNKPLYEEGSLCLSNERLLWFDNIDAQYVIHEHGTPMKDKSLFTLGRFEHSEYHLKSRYSTVHVNYNDGASVQTLVLNYHTGICLMRAINMAVRGFRAVFYSNDNSLIIREMFRVDGMEGMETEEMMGILFSIIQMYPGLVYLCENLIVILYYMGITAVHKRRFIANANDDFYDVVVRFLLSSNTDVFPIVGYMRCNRFDWQFITKCAKSEDRILLKRNLYMAVPHGF